MIIDIRSIDREMLGLKPVGIPKPTGYYLTFENGDEAFSPNGLTYYYTSKNKNK